MSIFTPSTYSLSLCTFFWKDTKETTKQRREYDQGEKGRFSFHFIISLLFKIFIYYFWLHWVLIAMPRLSLVVASAGFLMVLRLLTAVASYGRAQALGAQASQLWPVDSVAVASGFSCPIVCAIFLDQALNTNPLHWQAETLNHWTTSGDPFHNLLNYW